MTTSSGGSQLRGLAGSIERLFAQDRSDGSRRRGGDGDASGSAGSLAWVVESGVRLPGDASTADPLLRAVRAYVQATSDQPAGTEELESTARVAAEARDWTALADAAEALAVFGERDPDALDLAVRMVSPAVAVVLVDRVADPALDEGRRSELAKVLPSLGREAEEAVLEALRREALDRDADRSVRRTLLSIASTMAEVGSTILERMLDDADWRVVRNGIHLLGERAGDDVMPHLRRAVEHSDPRVRREAIAVLSKVRGDEAGFLAKVHLEDDDARVREQAARTVGYLRVELATRPLLALLEAEEDETVLVAAIRSVGLIGDPSAVPSLERRATGSRFSRSSQEVRVAAYRALAAIGTPRAKELLREALDDRDPEVQYTAQAALRDDDA